MRYGSRAFVACTMGLGLAADGCNGFTEGGTTGQLLAAQAGTSYSQVAELSGDAGSAGEGLGRVVALSGDALAASAPSGASGKVLVFGRGARGWAREARLEHPDALPEAGFGTALALDGRWLLVGAPSEDGGGAVYAYSRIHGQWILRQRIGNPSSAGVQFGWALALQGDTAVVGDPVEGLFGAAWVLVRSGDRFRVVARLASPAPLDDDAFGSAVALDGDTLVVGAHNRWPLPTESGRGSVHVFRGMGARWTPEAVLFPSDGEAGHASGSSVAVSGDVVVAGNDLLLPFAHVFRRTATGWVEEAELVGAGSEPTGAFGHQVAVSGDLIVVGAPWDRHGSTPVAGQAFLFRWSGTAWEQTEILDSDDPRTEAEGYGHAVALERRTVVVGAPMDDENGADSGAVYVFRVR